MKDENIQDPFYIELQKEINKIERKADLHTFLFYFVRIVLIGIAAVITLTSALAEGDYKETIIVLGVATTIITSIDTLFQLDAKRNTYKIMLYDFRTLRSAFVFNYHKNYGDVRELKDGFFEKYRSIKAMGRDLIGSDNN